MPSKTLIFKIPVYGHVKYIVGIVKDAQKGANSVPFGTCDIFIFVIIFLTQVNILYCYKRETWE